MLDQKLKQIALNHAIKMYDDMIKAFHNPLVKLEGEEANIFQYFNDWSFFEELEIDNINNKQATIKFLAMHKYKTLSTFQKPKRSKWEVVTGRQLKK